MKVRVPHSEYMNQQNIETRRFQFNDKPINSTKIHRFLCRQPSSTYLQRGLWIEVWAPAARASTRRQPQPWLFFRVLVGTSPRNLIPQRQINLSYTSKFSLKSFLSSILNQGADEMCRRSPARIWHKSCPGLSKRIRVRIFLGNCNSTNSLVNRSSYPFFGCEFRLALSSHYIDEKSGE